MSSECSQLMMVRIRQVIMDEYGQDVAYSKEVSHAMKTLCAYIKAQVEEDASKQ